MASIGSAPGIILGTGVGFAAAAALAPAVEVPKQEAWASAPNRILDVGLVARLVARGGIDLSAAEDEAKRDGYALDKLEALVYLEQTAPGSGEALSLWRLGLISDALFEHALVKAGLDPRYAAAIVNRKTAEVVGIGDVAFGIVRGILPAPAWVPVPVPTGGTTVPRFPQVHIDPVALAAKLGFDEDMLKLMTGRAGLSLAPGLAATALFRQLINENDYMVAIGEGDLRTEWAETLLEASRQILTVGEYVEGHLRGWTDQPTMYANTAKHGMSKADTDLAFQVKGRPIAIHQVTTGMARGGTYPSTYADVPEPFRKALEESDIRPEWASLAYANRYSYPSAFVMRSLAEAGDLGDTAAVTKLLEQIGWPPELAAKVAAKWVPAGVATTDPHVKKAQTTLFTEAHKAYVKNGLSVGQVTPAFEALHIPAEARTEIVSLWDAEKVLAADVPPAA